MGGDDNNNTIEEELHTMTRVKDRPAKREKLRKLVLNGVKPHKIADALGLTYTGYQRAWRNLRDELINEGKLGAEEDARSLRSNAIAIKILTLKKLGLGKTQAKIAQIVGTSEVTVNKLNGGPITWDDNSEHAAVVIELKPEPIGKSINGEWFFGGVYKCYAIKLKNGAVVARLIPFPSGLGERPEVECEFGVLHNKTLLIRAFVDWDEGEILPL